MMNPRVCIAIVLACCSWVYAAVAAEPLSVDSLLESIRAKGDLPALAAAVVHNGQIIAWGAVGVRKLGSHERVTLQDKWHIGSCTKSMTASVAGMLVEQEGWHWDMTVAEMLPSLAREIHPGWRKATLAQFLSHFSGAGNESIFDSGLLARMTLPPLEQRKQFIREFLIDHGPKNEPGTTWIYDNSNFVVVGYAIELKVKQPWETILRERLFKPLGMDSAGFGPPASGKAVGQPWGHVVVEGDQVKPMPPDAMGDSAIWVPWLEQRVSADNPAALAPAGMVHCSIGDLAKYAAWHLRGARGDATLLKASTFKKLHTPYRKDNDYACGWEVAHRDWAGGDAIFHGGSNGTFMTAMWLAPEKNFAVVVCSNVGGTHAEAVVDEAVGALIQKYLIEQ